MRRILCLCGLSILIAISAAAQAPQSVIVGQSFAVAFSHDGVNATGYRVYLDATTIADVPLSVLQSGAASIPVPRGVSGRGSHSLVVSAYNADAESKSPALAFTAVLPTPTPPSQPSIVITLALNADGTISAMWSQQ